MWKVSGIKSDFTAGRHFFIAGRRRKMRKSASFRKTLRHRKFSMWNFLGQRLSEPRQTQLGLTSNWFDQKNYEGRGIPRYFETDQDPNRPCRACVHSLGNLLKLFDRQGLDCYACLVTAFWRERCIFSWVWLSPSSQYSTRKIYF